jgi:hypothetical protein
MKITNLEQLKKLIDILKADYPDDDAKQILDDILEGTESALKSTKIPDKIFAMACADIKEEFGLIGFNNAFNKLV